MSQDITALRSALFETLEALRRKDDPIEIERARAVNDIAQTIINSAKVEIDFMKTTGAAGSGFIPDQTPALPAAPPATPGLADQVASANVRQHRLRG